MNNAFYKRETFLSIKRYKLMSLKMFVLCFICALIKTFTFSFGMSLKHDMGIISSLNEEYMLTSELSNGEFYGKSIDDLSIEYEGHNYKGINDYTYDFSITDMIIEDICSVDFKVSTISAESTLFSKGDSEELKSSPKLMGSLPKQKKEIYE